MTEQDLDNVVFDVSIGSFKLFRMSLINVIRSLAILAFVAGAVFGLGIHR